MNSIVLLLLVLVHCAPCSVVRVDLGGGWSLRNANGTITLPAAQVPGDVFCALIAAGKIRDPLYRYGDVDSRWVAYDNWTYSRTVTLPASVALLPRPLTNVTIVFEGLQVVANITVNQKRLLPMTTDQFQLYRFDLTAIVNEALTNQRLNKLHIVVAFMSSVAYATERYQAYTLGPYPDAPSYLSGLPYRNMIRTEQSSFGWDWGPAFAPQGIIKPVYLDVFPTTSQKPVVAEIRYVVPHVFPLPYNQTVDYVMTDKNNSFMIQLDVHAVLFGRGSAVPRNVSVTVNSTSLGMYSTMTRIVTAVSVEWVTTLTSTLTNVPLWWPRGYGAQNLHNISTILRDVGSGQVIAQDTIRTGIRAMELITFGDPLKYRPAASQSSTTAVHHLPGNDTVHDRPVMFFRVNGIPVFAKGANLIPFDPFQGRVNDTVMFDVLDSAVAANLNMIRVWGGGIFPLDSLYRRADELGLMLWQEMIFACAEYPIDSSFLNDVRSEISHQMRRLGKYVSVSIWSGNNENGIYDHGPKSPYEILDYGNVLYQIIREDTSRPIWPSSPSTGFAYGVTPSGLPAGTIQSPLPFLAGGKSGDTHFYNYFSCPNVTLYPESNFGSEFGFQSLPWLDNFAPVSEPQDWSLFSDLMNHRQHHPDGNAQIAALLKQNFQVPDLNSTTIGVFRRVIYLSQLQQLLCIADESSFYRRGRNMPYRTMGSLYWQLNQNWQAPSWTSLEYGGEWKILHYAMRVVYDTVHISGYYNDTIDRLIAHIASDHTKDLTNVVVKVTAVNLRGAQSEKERLVASINVGTVPALSGVFVWNASKTTVLQNLSTMCPTAASCVLRLEVLRNGKVMAEPQLLWLTPVREAPLDTTTTVIVNVTGVAFDRAALTLSVPSAASGPAVFVVVRNTKYRGVFSRNLLLIQHHHGPIELQFHTRANMNDGTPQHITSISDFQAHTDVQFLNQMWRSP